MMHAPSDVTAAARSMIGTPFHHLGRSPGIGLDCVGLLVSTAKLLGDTAHDKAVYARFSTDNTLMHELAQCLLQVPTEAALCEGMILVFRVDRRQMHAGIVGLHPVMNELTMIHAYNKSGVNRVCEHILTDTWRKMVIGRFWYPKVTTPWQL